LRKKDPPGEKNFHFRLEKDAKQTIHHAKFVKASENEYVCRRVDPGNSEKEKRLIVRVCVRQIEEQKKGQPSVKQGASRFPVVK